METPFDKAALPEVPNFASHLLSDTCLQSQTAKRPFIAGQTSEWESLIQQPALNRTQQTREAVLLSLCEELPACISHLDRISESDWKALLHWMDISGIALYFFDRASQLPLRDNLPSFAAERLHRSLNENQRRTHSMIAESIAIQEAFQQAGLSYAVLKGFSLPPCSVPKPELRLQFDLDFLIAESSASSARTILESRGYRLHSRSGRSWEFKRNEIPGVPLRDLYKDLSSWCVELHAEPSAISSHGLLARARTRPFQGIDMPVLSRHDLFLRQGLHVYKHICGEFCRASHLIEFRRHVLFYRDDLRFWDDLRITAVDEPLAAVGLGVVILLITEVMGPFAPDALTRWTVDALPVGVRLWVSKYGRRIVLQSVPGSKHYLILLAELETVGIQASRSWSQVLLPRRLPKASTEGPKDEPLAVRLRRHRTHIQLIVSRVAFHFFAGLGFLIESRQWRLHKSRFVR